MVTPTDTSHGWNLQYANLLPHFHLFRWCTTKEGAEQALESQRGIHPERWWRIVPAAKPGTKEERVLPPEYTELNISILPPKLPSDPVALTELRRANNPRGEAVGPFTGRCAHCGSNDLWDDNLAYGCNGCGALLGGNGP